MATSSAPQSVTIYIPELKKITEANDDGDFDKFGGTPSVEPDFKYPICKCCKLPLQFFFQLTSPTTKVTVQMFHCVKKDCDGSNDENAAYLRCINYAAVRTTNLDGKMQEIFNKGAYSDTDSSEVYYRKWLHNVYAMGTPYQCYKVTAWLSKTEQLRSIGTPPPEEEAALESELKWGGSGDTCQDIDYSAYMLHFGATYYLPFMWGDCGYFHISESLRVAYDCC